MRMKKYMILFPRYKILLKIVDNKFEKILNMQNLSISK